MSCSLIATAAFRNRHRPGLRHRRKREYGRGAKWIADRSRSAGKTAPSRSRSAASRSTVGRPGCARPSYRPARIARYIPLAGHRDCLLDPHRFLLVRGHRGGHVGQMQAGWRHAGVAQECHARHRQPRGCHRLIGQRLGKCGLRGLDIEARPLAFRRAFLRAPQDGPVPARRTQRISPHRPRPGHNRYSPSPPAGARPARRGKLVGARAYRGDRARDRCDRMPAMEHGLVDHDVIGGMGHGGTEQRILQRRSAGDLVTAAGERSVDADRRLGTGHCLGHLGPRRLQPRTLGRDCLAVVEGGSQRLGEILRPGGRRQAQQRRADRHAGGAAPNVHARNRTGSASAARRYIPARCAWPS